MGNRCNLYLDVSANCNRALLLGKLMRINIHIAQNSDVEFGHGLGIEAVVLNNRKFLFAVFICPNPRIFCEFYHRRVENATLEDAFIYILFLRCIYYYDQILLRVKLQHLADACNWPTIIGVVA